MTGIRIPESMGPSGTFAALERHQPVSPFDAGRIPCPQGGEDRWSARWLMEQLEYPTWQHFEPAVERAKTSAHNEGFNVKILFTVKRENSGGRPRTDYLLTRYAAYLVAMNGDPRKKKVSEAQNFFAVTAIQSEMAAPAPAAPVVPGSSFDLMRMMVDKLEEATRTADEAKALAVKSDARLDALEGRHDWYSALGYARLNGIPNTSTQFLNRVGRQASMIAKEHGVEPEKVPHPLFGEVNSYPAWVWERAFSGRAA